MINERENILSVAPAEGSSPLSVFRDKHSEKLAYPGIFLGKKRPENDKRLVPVHYSDICTGKSELRLGGGGGTPMYGLYRYVPRNRVWFLRFSVLK